MAKQQKSLLTAAGWDLRVPACLAAYRFARTVQVVTVIAFEGAVGFEVVTVAAPKAPLA